jgi:hypothetical protein
VRIVNLDRLTTVTIFYRCSGVSPNRATSGCLPSRSMRASKQVRNPCGVWILALCLAAIFDTNLLAGTETNGQRAPRQLHRPVNKVDHPTDHVPHRETKITDRVKLRLPAVRGALRTQDSRRCVVHDANRRVRADQ